MKIVILALISILSVQSLGAHETTATRAVTLAVPSDLFNLRFDYDHRLDSPLLDRAIVAALEVKRGAATEDNPSLNVTADQIRVVMPFVQLAYGGEPLTRDQFNNLVSVFNFSADDWLKINLGRSLKTLSGLYLNHPQIYRADVWSRIFSTLDDDMRSRPEYLMANTEAKYGEALSEQQVVQMIKLGRELHTNLWYMPSHVGWKSSLKRITAVYLEANAEIFLPKLKLLIDLADEGRIESARRAELVTFLETQIIANFKDQITRPSFNAELGQIATEFYLRTADIDESRNFLISALGEALRASRYSLSAVDETKKYATWVSNLAKQLAKNDDRMAEMLKKEVKDVAAPKGVAAQFIEVPQTLSNDEFRALTEAQVVLLMHDDKTLPAYLKGMVNGVTQLDLAGSRLLIAAQKKLPHAEYSQMLESIATRHFKDLASAMSELETAKTVEGENMGLVDRLMLDGLKKAGVRAVNKARFLRVIDCGAALKKDQQNDMPKNEP